MKKAKKILGGLGLIALAVLLLFDALFADKLGIPFFEKVSVTKLFFGAIFAYCTVSGLVKLKAGQFFFSGAILFMIFEKDIAHYAGMQSSNILSNWLLLLCALLLTIGFECLIPRRKHKEKYEKRISHVPSHGIGSSSIQYIDCGKLCENIEVNMSSLSVYFENVDNYQGDRTLNLCVNKGSLVLHIPKQWCVNYEITNNMGSFKPAPSNPEGKQLTLTGSVNMGTLVVESV